MISEHKRWWRAGSAVVAFFSVSLWAQGTDNPTSAPTSAPTTAPREQSIYIPYTKLREVFEREGRGVFLPYEHFRELWRAAREATQKPPEQGPPVAALITEVSNEAVVTRDVVSVTAQVRIEVLKEGWHEIPLRLGDAAIAAARVGDQPARIVGGGPEGYRFLLEKKGPEPTPVDLTLEYAKAYSKSPGRNTVTFEAPQAPVTRWRVRIPDAGVKVNIIPLIAATEVPAGEAGSTQPNETVVLAFVGAAPTVQIDWTPRAEGAQGLQALLAVRATHRVWIDEGVVRTRTDLVYEITRAAVDRLLLEAPADQKVVNVFDANVRQWSVQAAGDVQTITAELFEPATGSQNLMVELERFGGDDLRAEIKVPVVRALGVSRQQGLVAVAVGEGLRVEAARRTGLLQVDAGEIPAARGEPSAAGAAAGGSWVLSYRYATLPCELALRVERVEPEITADSLVRAALEPEALSIAWQAVYSIEKAGVFRLELEIPPGYELRNPRGEALAGATPVIVESYHVEGDLSAAGAAVEAGPSAAGAATRASSPRLIVNLGRKATGRVGLAADLYRKLGEPDLMSPTGKAASITIRVPRVTGAGIVRATGRLLFTAAESLRANPSTMEGLRQISTAEAMQWGDAAAQQPVPSGSGGRPAPPGKPESKPAAISGLAFAFAGDPAALALKVERRKPQITVRQLLIARVESGVVKYEATFFYNILYSAVPYLRIDLPADLADVVQNNTPGVRQDVLDSPAEPPTAGYVAWALRGETGFKGEPTIKLAWETKIDALDFGQSKHVTIAHLKPMEVDRAWGQIALAKAEAIDIRPTGGQESELPAGLRPIDPQHDLIGVPDALRAEGAARAFEFHDDWTLGVTATRYKLEEVKRTSIERALVRMVVTRSGQISAQALYRLRSAHQRLEVKLPGGVEFDTDAVRVNGRPVALERGPKDEFFVPLTGHNPDQPLVLEIRYNVPGGGTRLVCPEFPSQPAVQMVYLYAYLPPEWALLGSRGPWTDQVEWRWNELTGFEPLPPEDKLAWVVEGVSVPGDSVRTFQMDGRPYLYSTLRPVPAPAGVLRLVTLREWILSVIVFLAVILAALALLRSGAPTRLFAIGGTGTLVILLGVFFPTLLRQIVDGVLLSALAVVAILWAVWYLAWTRPRDPRRLARAQARWSGGPPPAPPGLVPAVAGAGPASASPGAAAVSPPPPMRPDSAAQQGEQRGESKGGPTHA